MVSACSLQMAVPKMSRLQQALTLRGLTLRNRIVIAPMCTYSANDGLATLLRAAWPQHLPLFVRISSVDAVENGWSIDDSVACAKELKKIGVDVIDCSSGGITTSPTASAVPREYGFQLPYAKAVRQGAGIATMAVGLIVDAHQAERALEDGSADLAAIARQALEDPNWPAKALTTPALERYTHWLSPYGWWLARRARLIDRIGARRG
jgi:2,4-dienoyl-CoA reductase-like NADH-dependent reductase (Old Yellow Enzyme family)